MTQLQRMANGETNKPTSHHSQSHTQCVSTRKKEALRPAEHLCLQLTVQHLHNNKHKITYKQDS